MKAVYIMGYGRSGSTFYESLLERQRGYLALGEIKYFAERGALKNERCSCGARASECAFWGPILQKMSAWDLERIAQLTARFESSKMFFVNVLFDRFGLNKVDLTYYREFNRALYEALSEYGPFIDSSKMPARAYFLSRPGGISYERVIWFLRDPRGVAWSCMKDVSRPEAVSVEDSKMPKFGFLASILKWILNSMISGYVAARVPNAEVKKYEGLATEVQQMSTEENGAIVRNVLHSISGNPRRLTGGLLHFKIDQEWESGLTRRQKSVAAVLCSPWMRIRQGPCSR